MRRSEMWEWANANPGELTVILFVVVSVLFLLAAMYRD